MTIPDNALTADEVAEGIAREPTNAIRALADAARATVAFHNGDLKAAGKHPIDALAAALGPFSSRVVTFHPQAWSDDYAIDVDPEGPTDFEVPESDIADRTDSQLDELRDHANAPEWVRAWAGPFWIEINRDVLTVT